MAACGLKWEAVGQHASESPTSFAKPGATTCALTFQRSSVKDNNIPYTEFRKSYGDFEVIIPAIDFSSLSQAKAAEEVHTLRSYEDGYVCNNMNYYHAHYVASLINNMITEHADLSCATIGSLIDYQLGHDDNMPFFAVYMQSGIVLRKAWCEHMANEIKREFGLAL